MPPSMAGTVSPLSSLAAIRTKATPIHFNDGKCYVYKETESCRTGLTYYICIICELLFIPSWPNTHTYTNFPAKVISINPEKPDACLVY